MGRSDSVARTVELRLSARAVAGPSIGTCPGCRNELDLHQPDSADPDRLLGTCPGCGAWSLIQLNPSGGAAHVVVLPGPVALARAFGTVPREVTLPMTDLASTLLTSAAATSV